MGLPIAELERQSSECLPTREVMTLLTAGQGGAAQTVADTSDACCPTQAGLVNVQNVPVLNYSANGLALLNDANVNANAPILTGVAKSLVG